ncbi:MAG TPA: hypothetical protein VFJ11_10905 [Gaiellaceae bacterium]|nr:hypothetical protein [Gaiellaceae bacterium]
MKHSERHRHLPDDVPWLPLADDTLDTVDAPENLDPAFEDAKQRPLITFVHGELARHERDVGGQSGKPVAFGQLKVREHRDLTDFLRRHHNWRRYYLVRPEPRRNP